MVTAVGDLAHVGSGRRGVSLVAGSGGLVAVAQVDEEEILRVRVGITVGGRRLDQGAAVQRCSEETILEKLAPTSGKSTLPRERTHRQLRVELITDGLEWTVVIRLAADGFALRYEMPDLWGVSTLDDERTALELDPFRRAWVLDYQTWYETSRFGCDVDQLQAGEYGFPVLLRDAAQRYVLVTESDIDGRFSGAHAAVGPERTSVEFRPADEAREIARGVLTPWRVFVLGDLATVVETSLVDELARPQHHTIADTAWVRPGRAAWSWWSDFYSGAQLSAQMHFVDEAARMGWEHLLIDCGWEETWVPEIVSYASRFGIQVHLWCVWHDLDGPTKLERLALWRSWGVAGIKVDFMESESKDRYRWYDTVLQETARLRLMVNFHGSVIPRGWLRTWPQVVSYEAIRGAEYYVFYQDTPLTAEHNVIQPFTRNVVGAMDYTPVALTAPGRTTSDAHELAMSVAFESGITHFADSVDTYTSRPHVVTFLSELPARWDETLLLGGSPDTEAVIARRSGDRWFIGVLATGPSRTLDISLERLGLDTSAAWMATDAPDGSGLTATTSTVSGVIRVEIAQNGGAVVILAPSESALRRARPRTAQALPAVPGSVVESGADSRAEIIVSPEALLRVPPRWQAVPLGAGRWAVEHPADLLPARGGVVTVETTGEEGVPLFSHIRVISPPAGKAELADLPMLAFENAFGPVERDLSNGGGNPRDGRRMSIAGVEHSRGLSMSAPALARFHSCGGTARLTGRVGVDDETPAAAAVVVVEADEREVFRTTVVAGQPPLAFDVDLTGARTVTLRAHRVDDAQAHVDWISPVLDTPRS